MDIIDKVTYDFEWVSEKDLSEETRRAFLNVFDPKLTTPDVPENEFFLLSTFPFITKNFNLFSDFETRKIVIVPALNAKL